MLPLAHALSARDDLPVPTWLFAWGAGIVLFVSFIALAAGWRRPRLEEVRWRPLGDDLSRALASWPPQVLCGSVGVFLLGLGIYAGLRGTEAPDRNFAVTFFFVTVWLGFPLVSALVGDLFRLFNPWRAIGRSAGACLRAAGRPVAHRPYPESLGRWPAALGLVAFVWLEIVYGTSGGVSVGLDPQTAAVAACAYSVYTLTMMAVFGAERWCERGEVFSVYFGMFARLGVFAVDRGRFGFRRPLTAAGRWATVPGSVALVVASIGTTAFDGAAEGMLGGAVESVFDWMTGIGLGPDASRRLTGTMFLLLCIAAVAAIYLLGVRGMRRVGDMPLSTLRNGFVHTLIPIALAYLVAHYFSLFFFQEQAQFTYLLSDPLGTGHTDLFGTASGQVDFGSLGSQTIWDVQVRALLVGHVLALVLAHDRALTYWPDPREATRSQYWMLGVMIAFTCLGLYLLSEGNS